MIPASKLFDIATKAILEQYTAKRNEAAEITLQAKKLAEGGKFELQIERELSDDIITILKAESYDVTLSDSYKKIYTISWASAQTRY